MTNLKHFIQDGWEVQLVEVDRSPGNQGTDIIVHLEKDILTGCISIQVKTNLLGGGKLTEEPETFSMFTSGRDVEKVMAFSELNEMYAI